MKKPQPEYIPFLYVIEYKPYRCRNWRILFGMFEQGVAFTSKEKAKEAAREHFALDHPDHKKKSKVRIRKYKRGTVCGVVK
jgi:hypothetical protein